MTRLRALLSRPEPPLALAAVGCAAYLWIAATRDLTDAAVYAGAGRALYAGQPLYDLRVAPSGLPFTYPPFAAIVFTAFAAAPLRWVQVAWTALSLACGYFFVRRAAERFGGLDRAGPWRWLLPLALAADPVRVNLSVGQVNLVIALAVIDDLAGGGAERWRGLRVGIAAAVKLTPLYFVAYLVAARRFRAAATALAAFFACTACGFAIAPRDSIRYFTDAALDPRRMGPPVYASNQSLYGLALRLAADPAVARALWLGAAAAMSALLLALAWRSYPRHARALDASAMALSLLASPISWVHHWLLALPLVLVTARAAWERRAWWLAALPLALAAALLIGPEWIPPRGDDRELAWSAWQIALGSADCLLALASLAALLAASRRRGVSAAGSAG